MKEIVRKVRLWVQCECGHRTTHKTAYLDRDPTMSLESELRRQHVGRISSPAQLDEMREAMWEAKCRSCGASLWHKDVEVVTDETGIWVVTGEEVDA